MSNFIKAERTRTPIKLELFGPPGAGKTWSALMLAKEMGYTKIAFIDTEKSADLYADKFDFVVARLDPHEYKAKEFIKKYLDLYNEALESGAEIIITDSATHLWDAIKDYVTLLGGRYTDWNKGTPLWQKVLNMLLSSPVPNIICSRADYNDVIQEIKVGDKTTYKVERLGLKADLRKMTDYEFTAVLSINENHKFICKKDRTGLFTANMGDEGVPRDLDSSVAKEIRNWIEAGKASTIEYKKITSEDIDAMESPKKTTSKLERLSTKTVTTKPAVIANPGTGAKMPAKKEQKNPLGELVPAAASGWEEEADALVMAIEECKTHEDILQLAESVDVFIADNHLQGEHASFLQDMVAEKIKTLEPSFAS